MNDVEPRYTIEEAAQRTGITAHTLRYYERVGLLEPIGRMASGHRRYTDSDIGLVEFLTCLRQTGMPIRQMQRFMELARAGDGTIAARVDALVEHRAALSEQLALLHRHFDALSRKIEYYRGLLTEPDTEDEHVKEKA